MSFLIRLILLETEQKDITLTLLYFLRHAKFIEKQKLASERNLVLKTFQRFPKSSYFVSESTEFFIRHLFFNFPCNALGTPDRKIADCETSSLTWPMEFALLNVINICSGIIQWPNNEKTVCSYHYKSSNIIRNRLKFLQNND